MKRLDFIPMKTGNLIKIFVPLVTATILALPSLAHCEDGGTALIQAVQTYYDGVTDYKAKFQQVVKRRSPKRTFTRSGTVYFKKPGMMRWDYKKPDAVHYVSDGTVLWAYDVTEGVAYKMSVEGSELFYSIGFLTGTAALVDVFNIEVGTANDEGLVPLKMSPKDDNDTSYRFVTLFVDPATGQVHQTEVEDPVGNISHLWFEKPSLKRLPESGFNFKVPKGVKVEDIDK
ncbi:MAG TPA: outer membrane lipoprotein carrier protein LolA [Myxococcota bacterium]|nr:outer membrane lipoprotein carrier protein LolA [Myxococcota bacterium]HQL57066.1 outer membrane lipoprotein carrier protein LolA [Myxococcota bacterium]